MSILHPYYIMADTEYYDILGLKKNASDKDIKKAYMQMAKKWHPDKLPDNKKAEGEEMIKKINEAYAILQDPKKRELYDQFGKEAVNNQGGPNMDNFSGFPFGNIFGGNPFGNNSNMRRRVQVPPVSIIVELPLEDIYSGKEMKKVISRYALCQACESTGFEDKKEHKCQKCNGIGAVMMQQRQGPMIIQQQIPCPSCKGSKQDTTNSLKCKVCDSKRLVEEKYEASFYVPCGIHDEDKITVKNEGHAVLPEDRDNTDSDKGDIVIIIKEKEHSVFKRMYEMNNPANMMMKVKINLEEALCGFKREFETLDGRKLCIIQNNVISDNDIHFIADEGMTYKNNMVKKGDLFIKYKVKYPDNLTNNQKNDIYRILTGNPFKKPKVGKDYNMVKTKHAKNYDYEKNQNDRNEYRNAYNSDDDGPSTCVHQ